MKRVMKPGRGFTLLEVMIASAIGVIVLGVGLVVGTQMQRRALFEEQTMLAQVTGRAVKELLAGDIQRAGTGMGNLPIQFGNTDERFAVQTWNEPNLEDGIGPFEADSSFKLPPAGTAYEDMRSDVLQLFWGDPRTLATMRACGGAGNGTLRVDNNFCTAWPPPAGLQPVDGQPVQAVIVDPQQGRRGCTLRVNSINVNADAPHQIVGTLGTAAGAINAGGCNDEGWQVQGPPAPTSWVTMRLVGASYRVNWADNIPTLEYRAPDSATWVAVSRDVERMKVRAAVIDLTAPNTDYRWFPDEANGRPRSIDQCTVGEASCAVNLLATEPAIAGDADLRNRLWQRVRELEISLVIRTRRVDQTVVNKTDPTALDDEGVYPQDGYKRRTFVFRVTPRNFVSAGLQPN